MNLMKYVPKAVTLKVGRSILLTQKHSPAILFGVGIVGVIATVVVASRATLKLEETVDEMEENLEIAKGLHDSGHEKYPDRVYQKDVAVQYVRAAGSIVRLYAPSVAVGVISIGCLAGSHTILSRRNASLITAYSILQRGFDEYNARVIEAYGPDRARELRFGSETHEVLSETDKGEPVVTEIKRLDPNGTMVYARVFSEKTSRLWSRDPMYNIGVLRAVQNTCSDSLHARGHFFLNEAYDALGLERTKAGQFVGWVIGNGDNYVDFGFEGADTPESRDFIYNNNESILLDFNTDGPIFELIEKKKERK